MTASLRVALAILWPPALVAAVFEAVGKLGFYPTDEGLVLAYAYRILHGQVPHRDFISPRPLGSGVLHTFDFLIPGPLIEVSRVIALCEYAAYGLLFAWLIYAVAPHRWNLAMVAGAAGSVLVNLNTFPIMAWYTVDGLLLISGGFVLIQAGARRDSRWLVGLGFVTVGAAALTKQSFAPAAAFAWLLLWDRLKPESWGMRLRRLVATGLLAAAPLVLFVAAIGALGGLHELLTQILGVAPVYGRPLLAAWSPSHDGVTLAPAVGLVALVTFGIYVARSGRPVQILLRLALSVLVLSPALLARLGAAATDWGIYVFWMAVAVWAVRAYTRSSIEGAGLALVGCAWMASLSYGVALPDLACGSLVLYMLRAAWSEATLPASWPASRVAPAIAAIVVLAITASVFVAARQQDVYRDRPASQLTAGLASVSPAFGDIRTNPNTAEYLSEMKACVRDHPARHVAILSENAAMYVVFELDNPFPIDWIWPYDVHGSEARILETVDRLNSEGDYLVMFETLNQHAIVDGTGVTAVTPQSPIYADTPLPAEILAGLNGTRSTCGPFVIVYSPAPTSSSS